MGIDKEKKRKNRGCGVAQLIECLPGMREALGSNPSPGWKPIRGGAHLYSQHWGGIDQKVDGYTFAFYYATSSWCLKFFPR